MVPIRFGVDVKAELERVLESPAEVYVTSPTIAEVRKLQSDAKPGLAREFGFAQQFAELCAVLDDPLRPGEEVDDQLARLSAEYVVATTDSDLRRRIRARGRPVVYLRQENRLALDGSTR